jgi:hypothetical protein
MKEGKEGLWFVVVIVPPKPGGRTASPTADPPTRVLIENKRRMMIEVNSIRRTCCREGKEKKGRRGENTY